MFDEETKDGQEQEATGQEKQEQAAVSEQVPAEPAKEQEQQTNEQQQQEPEAEANAPDPIVFDDDGISWKKKAKEYERKYRSTLEKIATSTASIPKETPPDENEEIPATRASVKQVLTEVQREEQIAEQVLDDTVDELLIENPSFAAYRDELRSMMKTVDISARRNPDAVKAVAMGLWGKKNWKPSPSVSKPVKKLVSNKQQDVLSPSPKGGVSSEVALTDDEQEYAEHHRFIGVFENEEIKEMYKKAHGKKKQGG